MVWKRILWKSLSFIAYRAVKSLFNTIDKDDSGSISPEEMEQFISDVRDLLTKMKRRA